jgi:phage repressor protein C with HTH and peptisase S24 domain
MSKRPLPPDKKEECLRLKALFNSRKSALGLTQEKLAHALDMNQSSVSHYLNGVNPLNASVAASFAKILGVDVSDFSERLAEEIARMTTGATPIRRELSNAQFLDSIEVWDDDTPLENDEVYVPFLKEVELSAGSGRTAVQESSNRRLRFGRISLRNKGVDPASAKCVTVAGNSMEPVLRNGSTVAVDTSNTRVIDGDMYAIDHAGQLRVKQLYRLPGGGLRLRSFNRDEHPDEEYTAQQIQDQDLVVLGRVFWSGGFH